MKQEIIECVSFPMVFAGLPGCLKTTHCRAHCEWLSDNGYNVLAVSFTNTAADQLDVEGIVSCTIDGFYHRMLDVTDNMSDLSSRNFSGKAQRFSYLLRSDSKFRKYVQEEFDCVVVDEGQDCNDQQLENLWLVSHGHLQIFADIDQCMYEWRGARPGFILELCKENNIKPIMMDETKRLTLPILTASQRLIAHNTKRINVLGWTAKKEGPPIEFVRTEYEVETVLQRIKEINSNDCAILVRNAVRREYLKKFWAEGFDMKPKKHIPYCGTIHGAKGLEWENVFILRANAKEFSRGSSLEEERRIFYTAMTRSCNFLHITAFNPICFIQEAGIEEGSDKRSLENDN